MINHYSISDLVKLLAK